MFDWAFYQPTADRPAWVPSRTIYLTRHGSHAYGTARPSSDLDIRGVCIAPRGDYHGFRRAMPPEIFEQIVIGEPNDLVVFEIRKFLALCVDANPNALELLFTDPSDHILVTPAAEELLAHRHLFLTKYAKHSFVGYANAQIHRMKLHYGWLHGKAPTQAPTRGEFGLPTPPVIKADQLNAALASVQKKLDQWSLAGLADIPAPLRLALKDVLAELLAEAQISTDSLWQGAARMLGYNENFMDLLAREKKYRAAVKNWEAYRKWVRTRNPDRAALEAKYGFDTKHGSQLVRLLREGREIVTGDGEKFDVRRPDAAELLEIRDGAWSYEKIIAYSEQEQAALNELVKTSKLPEAPDMDRIDALCIRIVEASFQ